MKILPNRVKPWVATHMKLRHRINRDNYSWRQDRVIHGWVYCKRTLEVPLPDWTVKGRLSCLNCTSSAMMPRILEQGRKVPICPERLLATYKSDYAWGPSKNVKRGSVTYISQFGTKEVNANPTQ